MQEYERNASRDFFESLVRADFDLEEIYRRADRLNLDIVAEAYNILIFTPDASDSSCNSSEGYSDWEAEVHKKIENYFLSHPVAMLFRHQVFSYAILVKGQRDMRMCGNNSEDHGRNQSKCGLVCGSRRGGRPSEQN